MSIRIKYLALQQLCCHILSHLRINHLPLRAGFIKLHLQGTSELVVFSRAAWTNAILDLILHIRKDLLRGAVTEGRICTTGLHALLKPPQFFSLI